MIGTNTQCKLLARILKINFQQKYWAETAKRNTKLCNASDVSWSVAVCKDCNTQGDNVQGVELSTIAIAECIELSTTATSRAEILDPGRFTDKKLAAISEQIMSAPDWL